MDLKVLVDLYISEGFGYIDAEAKVCQDVLLLKIANSKFLEHITIKGGVVMHNLSNDR